MKKSYSIGRTSFKKKLDTKKKTLSSQTWLLRHINDIYVQAAKQEGYASRASYKLIEINQKYKLFKQRMNVVDLGAAPGGWSQVVANSIFSNSNNYQSANKLIAVDLLPMTKIDNVTAITADFTNQDTLLQIKSLLVGEKADLLMSDMAPNTTGSKSLDHLRIVHLAELTFAFAKEILAENGAMVIKVFQGGTETKLLAEIKNSFSKISHFKPPASRKESSEIYLIAKGFKEKNK